MLSARRLFALHERSDRTGVPVAEVLGAVDAQRARRRAVDSGAGGKTRRELLVGVGGLAAGAVLAGAPAAALARPGPGRWALLDAQGLLFRWADRRARGSFLNSGQMAVRGLAARLGLKQEVVNGGDLPRGEEVFFIDGRLYTYAEANTDWHDVGFPAFRAAAKQLQSAAGAARLDHMSVPEWLDSTEIGAGTRFGKLMMANTVTENGGDPGGQSAQDLIYLLTGPTSSCWRCRSALCVTSS